MTLRNFLWEMLSYTKLYEYKSDLKTNFENLETKDEISTQITLEACYLFVLSSALVNSLAGNKSITTLEACYYLSYHLQK